MSGGGGSGGVGPVGPSEDVDCARLDFVTRPESPERAVVDGVGVVDELDLELQDAGGRRVIAVLTRPDRRVAGAITERTPDLLRCMQEGFAYEAEVTSIDGGWIELRGSSTRTA